MTATESHRAIELVWRIEQAKIIAVLARMVGDVSLAEEFAQEALIAAIRQRAKDGTPRNPAGWLMATGKRRAIDHLRRSKMLKRKHRDIGYDAELDQAEAPDLDAAIDDDIGDDLLGLIFTACHPVLSKEARTALTLRLVGGLTTEEIARAFLVPEPTMAQRIVRAKRALSEAKVPFEVPRGADRARRLNSVLEVIYLIFNEGYAATSGDELIRPQLADEALRLGRILAGLAPGEAEVHALVALMEIQASRFKARVDAAGEPVLLLDQNRAHWDQLLIRRGLAALAQSEALQPVSGPYQIQAAIAACHARARIAEATDWHLIARLYEDLVRLTPSPVIELNRAVAVAMAHGPAAGLELADQLMTEPSLRSYHLLPAIRGDFLAKLERYEEARSEFERAAGLTRNACERAFLLDRANALTQ